MLLYYAQNKSCILSIIGTNWRRCKWREGRAKKGRRGEVRMKMISLWSCKWYFIKRTKSNAKQTTQTNLYPHLQWCILDLGVPHLALPAPMRVSELVGVMNKSNSSLNLKDTDGIDPNELVCHVVFVCRYAEKYLSYFILFVRKKLLQIGFKRYVFLEYDVRIRTY